ncbi:MAG: DUF2007 domain-containing protein [bacterium]|nr:DUF2007 domain-containing protein [bacterium]
MPKTNQWISVYITHNLPEAHVIKGLLEHHGIPAMVNYVPGAGAIGISIGRLGEVNVLVHLSNYDLALAILDPDLPTDLPETTENLLPDDDQ